MADILTPALGESVTEATIAKWTKKVGDPVKKDELLVELETDKVSVEVPSPVAGVMGEHAVKVGDTVQVGDWVFNVRHCPGHTPGHAVFHSPEAARAFVGDVLFAGSIGRTDFPGGNHAELISSIRERLWPMGDDTVFIPGHGPESSFGQERRHNPFVRGG